jgi:hypothetical protein
MKFELNIEATVQAAIEEALAPATLRTKITELVGKVVDNALSDQFRSYGDFGKLVSAAIKTTIPHEVSINGAARFDHTLKQAIERRLATYNDQRMTEVLQPMLDSILEIPPAEIKLSKLVQDAKEGWADHHRRDGDNEMTVIVEQTSYGSRWVHMDPRTRRSKYECQVRIGVSDSDGKMFGLKIDGQEVSKTLFAGDFYSFERDLFALFTRGAKLTVDVDDFSDGELEYSDADEE